VASITNSGKARSRSVFLSNAGSRRPALSLAKGLEVGLSNL
jgi:hypothetical protein